jgi:hypothetical protein
VEITVWESPFPNLTIIHFSWTAPITPPFGFGEGYFLALEKPSLPLVGEGRVQRQSGIFIDLDSTTNHAAGGWDDVRASAAIISSASLTNFHAVLYIAARLKE